MIREALSHLHWSALPVFSMMLFMAVFAGAWLWVYRKGSGRVYNEISQYPLEKGDSHE